VANEPLPRRQRKSPANESEERPTDDADARRLAVNDLWCTASEHSCNGHHELAATLLRDALAIVTAMEQIDLVLYALMMTDLALVYARLGARTSAESILSQARARLVQAKAGSETLELFADGETKVIEVLRKQAVQLPTRFIGPAELTDEMAAQIVERLRRGKD
jgi:hypothetical protein